MTRNTHIFILFLLLLLLPFCFSSCGIYSFTGASIPAGAKNISIGFFRNRAQTVQPTLSQTFTEQLKAYFVSQSDLTLVEGRADLEITGDITGYTVTPTAIQGDDKAALNRMTITVQVNYVNRLDEKFSFNQSFSRYKDYDSRLSLASVEVSLIDQICTELVEDIYQRAFVNW